MSRRSSGCPVFKLLSPETFLKNRREEIRELEQNAVYLSGKLDLAQKQRQSSKELSDWTDCTDSGIAAGNRVVGSTAV